MNLKLEFELNDGSKFNNKLYLLAKFLIFVSFGYGIFKFFYFDDFANSFINKHLPYNLVQVKERNLSVFWIFIPGSIAIAVYEMLKHGKKLQNQLDELNEIN